MFNVKHLSVFLFYCSIVFLRAVFAGKHPARETMFDVKHCFTANILRGTMFAGKQCS